MKIKQIVKPSLAVLAAGILSACATIKQRQSRRHDRQSGFPGTYSVTLDNKRGTFPTYDELDQMRPGLTKDDIYKIPAARITTKVCTACANGITCSTSTPRAWVSTLKTLPAWKALLPANTK